MALEWIMDTLLPDVCVLCEVRLRPRPPNLLCGHCFRALPRVGPCCLHCALPLAQPGVCGHCLAHPLCTGRAVVPLLHEGGARHLVHRLKFQQGQREGQALGRCLAHAISRRYRRDALPGALIPTPMSWWNEVKRGHNQAADLAVNLSRALNIEVHNALTRRHGPPQRTLSKAQRQRLSATAFGLRAPIRASHVAVVDDVLTTGSTVRAMVALIARQGVARIDVWCATRAILG